MKNLVIFLFSIVSVLSGCNPGDESIDIGLLENTWVHSYEESPKDEFVIYRPWDSKEFSISRYRQVFTFEADRNCDYLVLAPTDGHFMGIGRWDYNENSKILYVLNGESEVLFKLEILSLKEDVLIFKYL